jgi:hypothetical protein
VRAAWVGIATERGRTGFLGAIGVGAPPGAEGPGYDDEVPPGLIAVANLVLNPGGVSVP